MKYIIISILSLLISLDLKGESRDTLDLVVNYHLVDIREMDDDDLTMYIDFLLQFKWSYPEAHKNKIDEIEDDDPQLWIPSVQIVNDYGLERNGGKIFYHDDNKISFVERYNGKISQKMEFKKFPFDKQDFEIDAVITESRPINLILEEENFSEFGALSIPGWDIVKGNIVPLEIQLTFGERPAFRIKFEGIRKTGFYLFKILLPIVLIVMMSWTVFWVDPTKYDAQLTISATSMLSLVAFLFTLSYQIPKISYLTKLDIFSIGSLVFVFLAMAEAVTTSYVSFHRHSLKARKIDKYSRVVFPGTYLIFIMLIFVF